MPYQALERPVLLTANASWNLSHFRGAIIAGLQERGYNVAAAVPPDDGAKRLREMGVAVHYVPVDPRGLSPLRDTALLLAYYKLLRRLKPAAVLGFTAKPNIYGSLAAARLNIPVVNTITGLGTAFLSGPILQSVISTLYRSSLRRSARVFFHNADDRDLFLKLRLVSPDQAAVVPGSGVDVQHFSRPAQSPVNRPITFLFIGRLLKDKGAIEFLEAAALVKKKISANFQIVGPLEKHPKAVDPDTLRSFVDAGTVELLGSTDDVRPHIANADCVVLPSYREGMPRVLLEASAMATPIIATDVPGCRQVVDHGSTGLLCEARSARSLATAMSAIAEMSPAERAAMGARGRERAVQEFSQDRVVAAYLNELRLLSL